MVGQSLAIHCRVRGSDDRAYVDVDAPDGRRLRLPVEWTDLGVARLGRRDAAARCTPEALVALRSAADGLCKGENAGDFDSASRAAASSMPEHLTSESHARAFTPDSSSPADDEASGRGMGDGGAPGADRDGGSP